MKSFLNHSFLISMVAGVFGGVAEPFILNACAQVSANWFPSNERAFATAIAVVAGPIGSGLGAIYSALFVDENEILMLDDPDLEPSFLEELTSKLRNDVENCFFYFAIGMSIAFVLAVYILQEKPPKPPSIAASIQLQELPLKKSFRYMFRNGNFLMMAISFGAVYGVMIAVCQTISMILEPFGFDHVVAAVASALTGTTGIPSAFLIGVILSKTAKYKVIYNVVSTGSCIAMLCFFSALFLGKPWIMYMFSCMFGFVIDPILSIGYEYGTELGYPVASNAVSGLILCVTNILASLLLGEANIIFWDAKNRTQKQAILFMCSIFAVTVIAVFFGYVVKEDLRRTKAEKRRKSENVHEEEARRMRNRSISFVYECTCCVR